MNSLHPDSAAAMTAHRREAVRLAEEQQQAVAEKSKRSKQPEPDYIFDELIGKGSFGRVYKGYVSPDTTESGSGCFADNFPVVRNPPPE